MNLSIETAREEPRVPISVPFRLFWLQLPPDVFPHGVHSADPADRSGDPVVRRTAVAVAETSR